VTQRDLPALQEKVADLAARGKLRSQEQSAAMRRHANESGFTAFARAFQAKFPGSKITYFSCPAGTFGQPHGVGTPFSDPAALASLTKKGRR
jgi:hypothetical protein